MLRDWQRQYPGRVETMFSALGRVAPSHLLDRGLFDFTGLVPDGVPDPDGDRAFDAEELPTPAVIWAPASRSTSGSSSGASGAPSFGSVVTDDH